LQGISSNTPQDYIRCFQNGEEKGFNFFFREYYAALCYFSFQIINNRQVAEEIADETLMKLWERHTDFNNALSIKSFLYTTARNTSLNWLREQKRYHKRVNELAYLRSETDVPVLHKIVEAELYREIHLSLKTLPPKCRQIFQMLFVEGKDYRQIAEELNLSINTIRSQKARALLLIRQRIAFSVLIFLFLLPHIYFSFF
jgi:RNA polymerase sigma-70 factor (ECF subfamily)